MITDYDVSSQDVSMYFSPLFPVITIVSTDHVYFHHKIVLMIVVIQNFQLEVVNKLKYVGDTGPDPEDLINNKQVQVSKEHLSDGACLTVLKFPC